MCLCTSACKIAEEQDIHLASFLSTHFQCHFRTIFLLLKVHLQGMPCPMLRMSTSHCCASSDHGRWFVQCYLVAIATGVLVDGACTMAILYALRRAGKWRIAEAMLFCVLSAVPSFSQIAADVCGEATSGEDAAWCQCFHSLRMGSAVDHRGWHDAAASADGALQGPRPFKDGVFGTVPCGWSLMMRR